ncbi:mitochondrial intermembrane space import and assembly protein 40-A-like [Ylistrum balloti]|uniref:mitochondrial intermembrane space import and assembly protein 40-A-like n=1 Tax=Ylistrum balloti TaxID=509963 RepID=UPI002905DD91|nr:mitochondrial intermembrane space import and assembly protein 40-A-like [Ylistrum balloti]
MSFCQEDGKDKYVFMTVEDANKPSELPIPKEIDRPENFMKGFRNDDGSLNWECACRGSMVASRCGVEMRNFFQCIHDNMDNEEKVDACNDTFIKVKECMDRNPSHYITEESNTPNEASEKNSASDKTSK